MSQEFFVQWHLTERCNLACLHCYQGDAEYPELLGTQVVEYLVEIKDTLDDWAAEYGIDFLPSLHLTGGEPLLYEELWDILNHSGRLGFNTTVLTNGTLVSDDVARRLAAVGVKSVQISLEGNEEVHDRLRGRGSFQGVLTGTRHLKHAGISVTLNVTLSRINAGHIEEMTGVARSLGANRLAFSRLVPSGRGIALHDEALTAEQVRQVYHRIFRLNFKDIELLINDPLKCLLSESVSLISEEIVPIGGCSAGVSGITVLPDGRLMACRRMNLIIGSLVEKSFREIWVQSPVLEKLRDRSSYSGRCRTCRLWSYCRGCRAIAMAGRGGGGFLNTDPHCWLGQES